MIHHKNFPFHEPEDETEIIHVNHPRTGGIRIGRIIVFLLIGTLLFFAVKSLFDLGKGQIYHSGTPVIEANPEPYKTLPENPGGMDIPHADKEIYGHIRTPLDEAVDGPIDAYDAENSRPPTIAELAEKKEQETIKENLEISKTDIKAPATSAVPNTTPQGKTIKIDKKGRTVDITPTAAANDPQAQKAKRIDVEKVLAKRTENEYWLQLGTFKSEVEATKAWQQTREKNADILKTLTVKVTKSDMKDQGVLYRLQAGSAEDEEAAKEYCRKLTARKQNCFYTIIKTQNNEL